MTAQDFVVPVFPDIAALSRYIAAAGPAGAGDVSAALRGVVRSNGGISALNADQRRMVYAAAAGRSGRGTAQFDLDRARDGLMRLAQGDVTLPANSIGQRIEFTEINPSAERVPLVPSAERPMPARTGTGRVVEVKQISTTSRRMQLVIERDQQSPEGWPRATYEVPADAQLTLVDNPEATLRTTTAAEASREVTLVADPPAAPPGPPDMTAARRALIVQAIEDYAARYGGPRSPTPGARNAARYIFEGHVPDGTTEEWDWIYDYLRAHPELLDRPAFAQAELNARRAERTAAADTLSQGARQAYLARDFDRSLELLGSAMTADPSRAPHWQQLIDRVTSDRDQWRATNGESVAGPPEDSSALAAEAGDVGARLAAHYTVRNVSGATVLSTQKVEGPDIPDGVDLYRVRAQHPRGGAVSAWVALAGNRLAYPIDGNATRASVLADVERSRRLAPHQFGPDAPRDESLPPALYEAAYGEAPGAEFAARTTDDLTAEREQLRAESRGAQRRSELTREILRRQGEERRRERGQPGTGPEIERPDELAAEDQTSNERAARARALRQEHQRAVDALPPPATTDAGPAERADRLPPAQVEATRAPEQPSGAADADRLIDAPTVGRRRWMVENMSDLHLQAVQAELGRRAAAGQSSRGSGDTSLTVSEELRRRASETPGERLRRLESTDAPWAQEEFRAARQAWAEGRADSYGQPITPPTPERAAAVRAAGGGTYSNGVLQAWPKSTKGRQQDVEAALRDVGVPVARTSGQRMKEHSLHSVLVPEDRAQEAAETLRGVLVSGANPAGISVQVRENLSTTVDGKRHVIVEARIPDYDPDTKRPNRTFGSEQTATQSRKDSALTAMLERSQGKSNAPDSPGPDVDVLLALPSAGAQEAAVARMSVQELRAVDDELTRRGSVSALRRAAARRLATTVEDQRPLAALGAAERRRAQLHRASPSIDAARTAAMALRPDGKPPRHGAEGEATQQPDGGGPEAIEPPAPKVELPAPEPEAERLVLPLDGPMRNLMAQGIPRGATVSDGGRSVEVTNPEAFGQWLDVQAAQRGNAQSDERKLRRAAIRLRSTLNDWIEEVEVQQPERADDLDELGERAAAGSAALGQPPTTRPDGATGNLDAAGRAGANDGASADSVARTRPPEGPDLFGDVEDSDHEQRDPRHRRPGLPDARAAAGVELGAATRVPRPRDDAAEPARDGAGGRARRSGSRGVDAADGSHAGLSDDSRAAQQLHSAGPRGGAGGRAVRAASGTAGSGGDHGIQPRESEQLESGRTPGRGSGLGQSGSVADAESIGAERSGGGAGGSDLADQVGLVHDQGRVSAAGPQRGRSGVAEQSRQRAGARAGAARRGRSAKRRAAARVEEAQFALFEVTDQPTDPRVIDPGGAPLPPPISPAAVSPQRQRPPSGSRPAESEPLDTAAETPSRPPAAGQDVLVADFAQKQQALVEQLAGGITSATSWPDRVARISFLEAALQEMRHDLLDVMTTEPRRGVAVGQALARLDTDLTAARRLLAEYYNSRRSQHDVDWERADQVQSAARAESDARDKLRRDFPDRRTALVTYLQRRVDRLETQIRLYPAPEWAGWGLRYRRSLPEQLDAARAELQQSTADRVDAPPAASQRPTPAPETRARRRPLSPDGAAETAAPERGAPGEASAVDAAPPPSSTGERAAAIPEEVHGPQPEGQPVAAEPEVLPAAGTNFDLGVQIRVPSGAKARVHANIAAVRVVRRLEAEQRPATADEQEVLARWSGWGAVPQVFDTNNDGFADERAELRDLLPRAEYQQAEASILNAHYTDPAVAAQIWAALHQAGFTGGRVLEPGCGSGNFIGLAPADAVMVGVETDPLTARIAAALYPDAQVRNEGFETTRVQENAFVATVGNVPFGNYTVYDPAHNPDRHSIHNYFILKSLALTAPGGYVAVITSRYTMDAVDTRARQEMAARADLVGAVRLPDSAFKTVAGTTVVTDILLFRKRDEGAEFDPHPAWVDVQDVQLAHVADQDGGDDEPDRQPVAINRYFVDNPARVLGEMRLDHGQYSAATLRVEADGARYSPQVVGKHLAEIVTAARAHGRGLTATAAALAMAESPVFAAGLVTAADAAEDVPLDTLRYSEDTGRIERWSGHEWVDNNTAKARIGETRKLIELRDIATSLVHAQLNGAPAAERDQLRALLNRRYDAYVETHGPVNRFKWTEPAPVTRAKHDEKVRKFEREWRRKNGTNDGPYTGSVPQELRERWDTEAWEPPVPQKRRAHLSGGVRHDPGWAMVAALENFDERTQITRKAAIFAADVVAPPAVREYADTPQEAMAICLGERRGIDVARIAELRSLTEQEAREELRGLVFADPGDPETLISAPSYLSGNVRDKLAEAEAAAGRDPRLLENVRALREVIPSDVHASQITVRPGAPWVPPADLEAFVREVLHAEQVRVDYTLGQWVIEVPAWQRTSVVMTEEYGTGEKDCDAVGLLEKLCNSKSILVKNPPEHIEKNPREEINMKATFAAQAKADKIKEAFGDWLFNDEPRRDRLVAEYNRRFNGFRAPRHDGTHLTFPGMSGVFAPHPYQRDAVARILHEPTVLLDHVVGAGKTGTMFMAAMELKRLGLVRQPWIVVPNHIIDQVGREAKQWYPGARVLMGAADTDADGRRRLIAQSATSDWDMVIVPISAFTLIGVSPEVQRQYVEDKLDGLRAQLEDRSVAVTRTSKKMIERAVKAAKARVEELTDQTRKDTGLRFENSGCDYLFIDEAHLYKNLPRASNVAELACTGINKRPQDLDLKLQVLRQRRRDEATAAGRRDGVERVATFATGTPIANSLGELWVMQHYLRPDLLEAAGVHDIDAWGPQFTATITRIEMNATGSKLVSVTRVGKFVNLPELLSLSAVFSDVVTRDQVPVGLPRLDNGQRRIVTTQPSIEVGDFITDLGFRSGQLDPRTPRRDNPLKIGNDGRNVSLDPRLAHLGAPADGGRAAAVAREITRIHEYSKDSRYNDEFGNPHPAPGALQIVFCDRGTPKSNSDEFTVYAAIRDELVARGMDPAKIRFVHDATNSAEKLQLQADCRAGAVSVLIGSTEKMGTGTNVQARAIALHHVDVPWRPADLEQREGRIIRQGNQNKQVEILNYVTEGTYDTVMWQKVEAKALFINQAKRNEVTDIREVEDLGGGDIGESAAATKAIATGDPRYLRQVELDEIVRRLTALAQAHKEATQASRWRLSSTRRDLADLADKIATLDEVLAHHDTATIRYTVYPQLNSTGPADRYSERKDAAGPFADACRQVFARKSGSQRHFPVGAINGIDVLAAHDLVIGDLFLTLSVPSDARRLSRENLFGDGKEAADGSAESPAAARARGILQRAENLYKELPAIRLDLVERQRFAEADLAELEARGEVPFEHADELEARRLELTELTAELRLEAESEAARAKAAAAAERLAASGREPGWSLWLNPTPQLVEEAEARSAAELRQRVLDEQARAAAEYARERSGNPRVADRPGHAALTASLALQRSSSTPRPQQPAPGADERQHAASPPRPRPLESHPGQRPSTR